MADLGMDVCSNTDSDHYRRSCCNDSNFDPEDPREDCAEHQRGATLFVGRPDLGGRRRVV